MADKQYCDGNGYCIKGMPTAQEIAALTAERDALREALEAIAARGPVDEICGGRTLIRCKSCGYRGWSEGEERHSESCEYIIARAALKGGPANG